jgi:hypothetical protein
MKKYLIILILLGIGSVALAAPSFRYDRTIFPEVTNTYELGTSTKQWLRLTTGEICLTGDCKTVWPSNGGTWATTSTNALLNASTTIVSSANSPLSISNHTISFTDPGFLYASVASSTYLTLTGASTTYQQIGNYVNSDFASSTFVQAQVASSSYVTYTYASTTYATTAYATTSFPWLKNGLDIYNSNSGSVGVGSSSPFGTLSVQTQTGTSSLVVGSSTGTYLIVNKIGYVGIGTTTPYAPLSVSYDPGSNSIPTLALGSGANVNIFETIAGGRAYIGHDSTDGNLVLGGGQSKGIAFYTNGTTGTALSGTRAMSILSGGNLGIGTSTPNWKTQINGTRPSLALSDSGSGANAKHWLLSSMGGILYVGTSSDVYATTSNPALTILNNGQVGFGTSTPFGRLAVDTGVTTQNDAANFQGSINDFLQVDIRNSSIGTNAQSGYSATADNGTPTTNFAWMGINNSKFYNPQTYNVGGAGDVEFLGSGNDLYIANASATAKTYFLTGGTATTTNIRATITSTGNFGINKTAPVTTLDVFGTASSTNVNISALGTPAGSFLAVNPTGQVIATTTPSGGSTVYNTYTFQFPGAISTSTNIAGAPLILGTGGTIVKARASIDTAPSGQSLITDIKYNSSGGAYSGATSIWATNPGKRLTLLSGTNATSTTLFDTISVSAGGSLYFDVAQAGTTASGTNMTLILVVKSSGAI